MYTEFIDFCYSAIQFIVKIYIYTLPVYLTYYVGSYMHALSSTRSVMNKSFYIHIQIYILLY